MKMNSLGIKLISLLLTVGGAAGAGVFIWGLSKIHFSFSRETLAAFAFFALFCWSMWTGIELWRNKPRAYKSAIVLLALQIPTIVISAFTYQFYTGLLVLVSFSFPSTLNFECHIASSIGLQLHSQVQDPIVGINLVAVAALIWIIRAIPPKPAVTPLAQIQN